MNGCKKVQSELDFLRLRGYDWDGTGGLPIREDAADLACDLFDTPEVRALAEGDSMPTPGAMLNPNGTINISFGVGRKELLLTFQCQGVLTYVKQFDDDQTTIEGIIRTRPRAYMIPSAELAEFLELFKWLNKGTVKP